MKTLNYDLSKQVSLTTKTTEIHKYMVKNSKHSTHNCWNFLFILNNQIYFISESTIQRGGLLEKTALAEAYF